MTKPMETLLQELQSKSIESYEKHVQERNQQHKERDERMKDAINKMYDEIVSESTEKMTKASEAGNFGCVLFECSNEDTYDDEFKSVFLLKGPVRWTKEVPFFESKGIEPLVLRIKKFFVHGSLKR